MLIKLLSMTILATKFYSKYFTVKWYCNLNVIFIDDLISIKQNLPLKWQIWPKSDKKKKCCLLPIPTLKTTRIMLSSGPGTSLKVVGKSCTSFLTNQSRLNGHSKLTRQRNHRKSWFTGQLRESADWMNLAEQIHHHHHDAILRCLNFMSYKISPCFHPSHLTCWLSCHNLGRDPELFILHCCVFAWLFWWIKHTQ